MLSVENYRIRIVKDENILVLESFETRGVGTTSKNRCGEGLQAWRLSRGGFEQTDTKVDSTINVEEEVQRQGW